jgi:hypothetical protein
MTRTTWTPETQQTTTLNFWDWRDQTIKFVGATTAREVRLDYLRLLNTIVDGTTTMEIAGSMNFLAYKTAALAADSIGGNQMLSDRYHMLSAKHMDKLLKVGVRANQANRARRRPFRLSIFNRLW